MTGSPRVEAEQMLRFHLQAHGYESGLPLLPCQPQLSTAESQVVWGLTVLLVFFLTMLKIVRPLFQHRSSIWNVLIMTVSLVCFVADVKRCKMGMAFAKLALGLLFVDAVIPYILQDVEEYDEDDIDIDSVSDLESASLRDSQGFYHLLTTDTD